jgi:hypothetical protein
MDWVEELRASLLRAGDHISEGHPTLYKDGANGGSTVFVFKLWHQLPADAKRPVTAYIRGFAKSHGWDVKIKHYKFAIEVTAMPIL